MKGKDFLCKHTFSITLQTSWGSSSKLSHSYLFHYITANTSGSHHKHAVGCSFLLHVNCFHIVGYIQLWGNRWETNLTLLRKHSASNVEQAGGIDTSLQAEHQLFDRLILFYPSNISTQKSYGKCDVLNIEASVKVGRKCWFLQYVISRVLTSQLTHV